MGLYIANQPMNLGDAAIAAGDAVPQESVEEWQQTDLITKLVMAGQVYYVPAEDEVYEGPVHGIALGGFGAPPHPSVLSVMFAELDEAGLSGVTAAEIAAMNGEGSVGNGLGTDGDASVGEASPSDLEVTESDIPDDEAFNPAEYTAADVVEYAKSLGDDVDALEVIMVDEQEGLNRKTIKDKVQYLIDQINAEAE